MNTITIQDVFEMRKNGKIEEAYQAVLPMYREHHGHYTTLCMFWAATDVMRLRIESGKLEEAEQIFAALRNLYPNLSDKEQQAARTLNRLALMLAEKEQLIKGVHDYMGSNERVFMFSLLDYMFDFGRDYLLADDWTATEYQGRPLPSFGAKILGRIFREISEKETSREDLIRALFLMDEGILHSPHNRHIIRYRANILYRLGEKDTAITLYRQLIEHRKDSYLFSELAQMVDDVDEKIRLLIMSIRNQRMEVFTHKDRTELAKLLKDKYPTHAVYEANKVKEATENIGLTLPAQIKSLLEELKHVGIPTEFDQEMFYQSKLEQA